MQDRAPQRARAMAAVLLTVITAFAIISAPCTASPGRTLVVAVSLSPASISFGSQSVGTTSATHTVTLSNTGNATLSVSSVAITGSNASNFAQTQ